MSIDPNNLPDDTQSLRKIVLDLMAQLDREFTERHKIEALLRELLDTKKNRKSEQLSKEQLALFEEAWRQSQSETESAQADDSDDDTNSATGGGDKPATDNRKKRGGRQPLARHLPRERVVHDLAEPEKHCSQCAQDLRQIGEETSERYEYVPASLKVIEDVCLTYACQCTVRTAGKPPQPIEKSTAGASLLSQVIVSKFADHLPLHRQEKMFERYGVDISRKTMGGWMKQCAGLLDPLYETAREVLLQSKVIGTDDTTVKVLDVNLPVARNGRIWPYVGDKEHPVIIYDYTPTRERAGPEKFLEGYRGYLQADAYSAYDAFFTPAGGMTEVGCWMHARRYMVQAMDTDERHMGPALFLVAKLYEIEDQARSLTAEQRLALRQRLSKPILGKLHDYLLTIRDQVLPKSPSAAAVRYALNQWTALNRYVEDGDLEIDNGATERANRDIAIGRNNWVFFGSDSGGETAAVLRTFVASCKRVGVEPFAWFKDVLSRIANHPVTKLVELLPHNWAATQS